MKRVKMGGKRIIALILALTMAFGTYVTVFAKQPTSYTIHYDENTSYSVTGTMQDSNFDLSYTTYTLPENNFKVTGQRFLGWATSWNGKVKYNDKATLSVKNDMHGYSITLYAVWGDSVLTSTTSQSYYYDGKEKEFKLTWDGTAPSGVQVLYGYYDAYGDWDGDHDPYWDYYYCSDKPTNVGSYNILIYVNGYAEKLIPDGLVINKATPDYIVPSFSSQTYDSTRSLNALFPLTNGWSWSATDANKILKVGAYTFNATYTPSDTTNYNTVTKPITVEVTKATPVVAAPVFSSQTYDSTRTLNTLFSLTNGWSWSATDATKMLDVGKYTFNATYTPSDSTNYNTVTKPITVEVTKATPNVTAPTFSSQTYDSTKALKDLFQLTNGWTWSATDANKILEVGTYTFSATYTPSDTTNYNTVTKPITVEVTKATPIVSTPSFSSKEYDSDKSLKDLFILPNGWSWDSTYANTVLKTGKYTFDATFTPADTKNYEAVKISISIEVTKAIPKYNVPTTNPITYNLATKLESVNLISSDTNGTWTWDNKDTTPTVLNGGYSATFTPNDQDNYIKVTKTITLTVSKATPDYTIPTFKSAKYSADTKLTDAFKFADPTHWSWSIADGDSLINAGTTTYKAIYTPDDKDNYKIVTDIPISIDVYKATYSLTDNGTPVAAGFDGLAKPFDITTLKWSPETPLNNVINVRYVNRATNASSTTAPTSVGEYDVYILAPENNNYEKFGETRIQKAVIISKATPTPTIPTGMSTTYKSDLTLKDVPLPTGWAWDDSTMSINVVGNYTGLKATYTKDNSGNYETVTAELSVVVNQADANPTAPTFASQEYQAGKTLQDLFPLSGEWSWKNDSDSTQKLEVGSYTFDATYTPADTNYESVTKPITVEVTQASYEITSGASQTVTYDTKAHSFDISKLTWSPETPSDITVKYYQNGVEVTDPTNAGTYDVVISVAESKNYKAFEKTITGGLVIEQATPTPKIPQFDAITYDPHITLASMPLQTTYAASGDTTTATSVPGKWSWDKPDTVPTVGTSTYGATFTPTDSKNYKSVKALIPLTVKAAVTIDDSQVPHANLPTTDTTGSSNGSTSNGATVTIADNKVAKSGSPAKTSDANGEMLITSLSVLGISAAGLTAILNKKKKDDM